MMCKKSKILLIILIFMLVFNFCSPTVLAIELIDIEDAKAQAEGYENAGNMALSTAPNGNTSDDSGSVVGAAVDFIARYILLSNKDACILGGKSY